MKKNLKLFLFLIAFNSLFSQNVKLTDIAYKRTSTFEIGEEQFLLNGKTFVIRCGEMHFARIPKEYWADRLKMAKAMGLNTVCAYLFWNMHEPQEGKFNWSGMADVAEFCKLAQKEGLFVILRPGPYSCAEWDFGGFPWWLLKKKDLKLRTQDPYYLERCKLYLTEVGKILGPLQIMNGGPIIMTQVENEYGSYGSDKEYIGKIRDYLVEAGFKVPLFTCDGPSQLKNDVRNDIFSVVNFGGGGAEESFNELRKIRATGPLMCGEYYPGWFDSWGLKHHIGDTNEVIKDLQYMLERKISFSIYMAHGGTTFGQWAGANSPPFKAQTSTYDYDAPISEAGWETEKFFALRQLFSKFLQEGEVLPKVPLRNPVFSIPELTSFQKAPLFSNLPSYIADNQARNMEEYNQDYGCILYRTSLDKDDKSTLVFKQIHDYAIVFINGKKIATLDRAQNQKTCLLPPTKSGDVLDILVEAMGRVNYGPDLHDRKGINDVVIRKSSNEVAKELTQWKVYPIVLKNDSSPLDLNFKKDTDTTQPAFYKTTFSITKTADTFLDVSQWGKGLVWLNGHCLGRFWNIGPTQTMYVPAPWLKKGKNEILILDYIGPTKTVVSGITKPILDQLKENPKTQNL